MTLRSRLAVAAGVAVALAVLAVTVTAYAGTESELRRQVDRELQSLMDRINSPPGARGQGAGPGRSQAGQFAPGRGAVGGIVPGRGPASADGSVPGILRAPLRPRSETGGSGVRRGEPPGVGDEGLALDRRRSGFGGAAGIVTLIHRNGTTFVPPAQSRGIPVDAAMRALAARGSGELFTEVQLSGAHLRVFVRGLGPDGALAVALPMSDVDHTLSAELLLLVVIAAVGVGLAALLGVLVARTALAPIGRFTRQAESIAANPERLEHERFQVEGSDELARLGSTFNTTLDALERAMQAQRNLVADASHELRTPIASVRANLQLLREEALLSPEDREALRRDMIEELDELTALVADVVELARGAKPSPSPGDVRLDAIVEEASARARRRGPALTVRVELEPTLVRGEGDRIARAVTNLLDNAAKWSPPDGLIEVFLRDGVLTVRDHGPGFRKADLPYIFDRFHRAPEARSKPGSGLGLAIVRQAAEAHGGQVQAENAPGGGALVRVSFGEALPLTRLTIEKLTAR